jgi:hypothetical protein
MPLQVDVRVNLREHGPIIRSAVTALTRALRDKSRANLAAAHLGKFGAGAYTTRSKKLGNVGYQIDAFLKPRFLKAFETGAVSVAGNRRGSPRPATIGRGARKGQRFDFASAMLWIPVPPLKIKARKYGGGLIRPPGTNVLVRKGGGRQVMYVGVKSVTIPKRTGLVNVAMQEASKFVQYMRQGIYDDGKSQSASGSSA